MGIFRVDVEIVKPADSPDFRSVGSVIVDPGSEMTWVRGTTLAAAGIDVRKSAQPFVMANDETINRDVAYAVIRCDGFETIDEIVFALDGDLQHLGARTLEGFNATVDAGRRRLVAAGPIPAASASPDQKRSAEPPRGR